MDQRTLRSSGLVLGSGAEKALPRFDVSIILNLHDEARYLRRTMLSLEEAVRAAKRFDITFELVVVLDTADPTTQAMAEFHDYSVFDAVQIVRVRNGSLGPSRNAGIRVARGAFIATADADDLVAFDYFLRLYRTAAACSDNAIVFPEYHFGFGIDCYAWKFWSHAHIGSATFFERHPYVSRVMFRRELFQRVQFADASLRSGHAYEDWHFNCECLAAGCSIEIARDAVLFYRQRSGSLLRRADSETSRLIPRSRYFEPETYVGLVSAELNGGVVRRPEAPFNLEAFHAIPGIGEIVAAANRIDPAISLGILDYRRQCGSNYAAPGTPARAYFELCRQVAGQAFTDVLLVPFFAKGGAKKYILSVIDGLRELQPQTRLLVVATQKFEAQEWLDRLPGGSLFIDMQALGELDAPAIGVLVYRLVQHLPGLRRLHLKNCEFVDAFSRKYLPLLKGMEKIFYLFCDEVVTVDGLSFVNGHCFDLISEAGHDFTHIVSDHAANIALVRSAIGGEIAGRAHTLYAECPLPATHARQAGRPSRRLLWASRIDGQKRPELVACIARLLEREGLEVRIYAYGGTTYGRVGPDVFCGAPLLTYKGAYDGFDQLPVEDYDGLLYTAAFDGLPNVVLEAMAAELPVIAPDIGGIGEAVTDQTGYLVLDDTDADRLAGHFVDAIREFYDDWPAALRRGENGRRLVAERHARGTFMRRVAELFDIERVHEIGLHPVTAIPETA